MDALVLCGGRGSRLDAPTEKPLFAVAGEPMLDRVRRALARAERVDRVALATSPLAPRTARHVAETARPHERTVATPGEGYVADLGRALRSPAVDTPVLTVVADLPLLAPDAIDGVVDTYRSLTRRERAEADTGDRPPLTVCVPTALKDALGVSADTTRAHGGVDLAPTGLNVVGSLREGGDAGDGDTGADRTAAADGVERTGIDDAASGTGTDGAPGESGRSEPVERLHVTHDARLAVNVNRRPDAAVAERLAGAAARGGGTAAGSPREDPGGGT